MKATGSALALLLCLLPLRLIAAPEEERARAVISRYVVSHTGWKRSVFRIEKGRAGRDVVRYEVIYIPEEKLVFIGGGNSFAVEYNPRRREVVREWHYQ
jgi:hypothetical protein